VQALAQAVRQLLEQHQLQHRELQPRDSLSGRSEGERQLVQQLVTRCRELPEPVRRQLPALIHCLGKQLVVAGDFDGAQRHFQEVATLTAEPRARAEAHYHAYRAALEQRRWDDALAELKRALALDPGRFAPVPRDRYELQRILGAGGFGVAFLSRDQYLDAQVVVKALLTDDLNRDVAEVFAEAQALRQLDHAAIIRVNDCGYAVPAAKKRPYLVMDYFPGVTLEEFVEQRGALTPDELLAVAVPVAEALELSHRRHILHRDVKPGNLLVRKRSPGWQVKLIDFGLALRRSVVQSATLAGLGPHPPGKQHCRHAALRRPRTAGPAAGRAGRPGRRRVRLRQDVLLRPVPDAAAGLPGLEEGARGAGGPARPLLGPAPRRPARRFSGGAAGLTGRRSYARCLRRTRRRGLGTTDRDES
jgi:tRNA A-37 threonylcarbamoyl transferase component Bud32